MGGNERETFHRGRENGGVPARTLNLLNALARAWNASISLFYFGPFVRHRSLLQFYPFYSRPAEPAGRYATLSFSSCPFVQIWWPSRYDLTMIQLSTANWNEAPTSWTFSRLVFYFQYWPVRFRRLERPDYWFNPGRYDEYKLTFLSDCNIIKAFTCC